MSKTKITITQGKNTPSVQPPQNWPSMNTTTTTTRVPQVQLGFDEFKYGFPSQGLAVVSHKWWESDSDDISNNLSTDEGVKSPKSPKHEVKSEESVDHGDDVAVIGPEMEKDESDTDLRGTGLLSHLRKRAAEEGKQALKLGVYRGFAVSKLGRKEEKLLSLVFKSVSQSN